MIGIMLCSRSPFHHLVSFIIVCSQLIATCHNNYNDTQFTCAHLSDSSILSLHRATVPQPWDHSRSEHCHSASSRRWYFRSHLHHGWVPLWRASAQCDLRELDTFPSYKDCRELFSLSFQISTNGYFSFTQAVDDPNSSPFPNENNFIVAPFWTDNEAAAGGISYEVHTNVTAGGVLSEASSFISAREGVEFSGRWMLLIDWREIPTFSQPLTSVGYK